MADRGARSIFAAGRKPVLILLGTAATTTLAWLLTTVLLPGVWDRIRGDSAGPPVKALVETGQRTFVFTTLGSTDGWYVFRRPISELGPAPPERWWNPPSATSPDVAKVALWLNRHPHADAGRTQVDVDLTGRSPSAILIDRIRVRVLHRRQPLRGAVVKFPVGGGGGTPYAFDVNLDRVPPQVRLLSTLGRGRRIGFSLRKGEQFFFELFAHTKSCDCTWLAYVDLMVDGRERTITIHDPSGKPFETTPRTTRHAYTVRGDRWVPCPPRPASEKNIPRLWSCV